MLSVEVFQINSTDVSFKFCEIKFTGIVGFSVSGFPGSTIVPSPQTASTNCGTSIKGFLFPCVLYIASFLSISFLETGDFTGDADRRRM